MQSVPALNPGPHPRIGCLGGADRRPRGNRAKWGAAVLALALLSACGGGNGDNQPSPEGLESASSQPTPTEQSTGTAVVSPEPNVDLTLQAAFAAAQAQSCEECVTLNESPERQVSASRGLVDFDVRAPGPGSGGIELWGFTGATWGRFASYQNPPPPPSELPADIWICTDESASNVRSGPGTKYSVLAVADSDVRVAATFFRLTSEQPPDEVAGEGWFLIGGPGLAGWVSSTRVASDELGCGYWRDWLQP